MAERRCVQKPESSEQEAPRGRTWPSEREPQSSGSQDSRWRGRDWYQRLQVGFCPYRPVDRHDRDLRLAETGIKRSTWLPRQGIAHRPQPVNAQSLVCRQQSFQLGTAPSRHAARLMGIHAKRVRIGRIDLVCPAGRRGTSAVRLLLVRFVLADVRGSFHRPVIPQEQIHVLQPGIGSLGKAGSGSAIQTSESAPG